ncbi:hypothetical protein NEF87_000489 [Candidatus Lokiarchaeum ossiferum]|uniref:Flavodoxin-like domain-containing protein n=1 Tax=Candidatus Lokiarchaeum ossiferum TaxID=2951803 RepID=A0ABY6HNZ4_9ARCH|nr:hypothetical protein NEF87_000489 [Candidatus Lokiarchaeum sp. B-35]
MNQPKILIVYGSRYGATADSASRLAHTFRKHDKEVTIVNLEKEKVPMITNYRLVVLGTGIKMDKWNRMAEKFLKLHHNELKKTKFALFVSSGYSRILIHKNDQVTLEKKRKKYITDKIHKYKVDPIAMNVFGGIWDYNKMSSWFRMVMTPFKEELICAGITENPQGTFDTRDFNRIDQWSKDLLQLVDK